MNRLGGILVLVGVGLVILTGIIAGSSEPTLESVDSQWGEISKERSEIRSEIVISNPNPIGIPPLLTIQYDVRLNSVTIANGERQRVGLPPGTSTIRLSTAMNNTKIADWWVTHVDNAEQSTLTIAPRVSLRWVPVTVDLPSQQEPVTTDVLDPINNETEHTVALVHEPHLVIDKQEAKWGQPTDDLTPIEVSTTFENRFRESASITNITYRIRLNEVVAGSGRINQEFRVSGRTTKILQTALFIENAKMNDWWVSHLRHEETTTVTIEMYATLSVDNTTERVQIQFPEEPSTVETDVLGQSEGNQAPDDR